MTNATLRGKPDAGNPHVRFDEGEVASAKPRRGSLLYKKLVVWVQDNLLLLTSVTCVFALLVWASDYVSTPWYDKNQFADAAINLARGHWWSRVFIYTYHPLYLFVLTLWVGVFGESHRIWCALDVLFSVGCFLILLRLLRRRAVEIRGLRLLVLLSICFSGWTFIDVSVNGRPDLMVVFWLLLVLDELLPLSAPSGSRWSAARLFTYSFLLMASSVYAIPLLAFICLVLFAAARTREERMTHFKKCLMVASAVLLSFVVCFCLFLTRGVGLRFVYGYVMGCSYFNGATVSATPLLGRLAEAYQLDPVSLLIWCAAFISAVALGLLRGRAVLLLALTTGAVPALMVLSGRYTWYYTGLFHFAALGFAGYVLSFVRRRAVSFGCLICAVLSIAASVALSLRDWNVRRSQWQAASAFVARQADRMSASADVVCTDANGWPDGRVKDQVFYSELVRLRKRIWMGAASSITNATLNMKFATLARRLVSDPAKAERVCKQFRRVEKEGPAWPVRGYLFSRTPECVSDVDSVCRETHSSFRILDREGDMVFAAFELNPEVNGVKNYSDEVPPNWAKPKSCH